MPKALPKRLTPLPPLSSQLAEDERAKHTRKTREQEWDKSAPTKPEAAASVLAAIDSDEREGIDNASPELIARIWATARLVWVQKKKIEQLTSDLADATAECVRLTESVLPEMMSEAQTKELTSDSGVKLEKCDKVYASISKANEADAMKWLEQKGFGAIIKSAFSIPVDKGDTKTAKLIRTLMKKNKLAYEEKSGVHHQTLQAFVRESIEKARALPASIAYVVKPVVEIKLPKAKKTTTKFVSDSNDINL